MYKDEKYKVSAAFGGFILTFNTVKAHLHHNVLKVYGANRLDIFNGIVLPPQIGGGAA